MTPFTKVEALAAPLDRSNVDTDQIIPKQFLRSIRKSGFGPFLFDEWRYEDRGELGMDCSKRPRNPDFVLNKPECAGAEILLARHNFGCGSSREHAVWALADFGFRAVLAPSFGDIFYSNAVKNGMLAARLSEEDMDALFLAAPMRASIDLDAQMVRSPAGEFTFEIEADDKTRLLRGLDDIALTLERREDIAAHERRRREQEPWLFEA